MANWFRIPPGERLLTGAVIGQIVGLMLVGGGLTGLIATMVITVLTVTLLGLGIFHGLGATIRDAGAGVQIVLAGLIVLPLLQLVPLPPAIWQHLPGQALRVSAYSLVGVADRWQPLSLSPLNTQYTVLMAIAFVTLVTAMMTLSREALLVVLRVIVLMIVLGMLVGVGQVASGGSALRMHLRADHGALIGFFTNKNHMALALAASLPMAAATTNAYDIRRRGIPWSFVGYLAIVAVAVVMTNSRAGVMMVTLATLLIAMRALRDQPRRYVIGGLVFAVAIVGFLLSLPGVNAVFDRFNSVGEDLRWRFAEQSVPLLKTYWLYGSGSGSFVRLYAVNENLLWVKPTFVNNLHDDYYQVAIEQGAAGMLLLLLTGAVLIIGGIRAWHARPQDRDLLYSAAIIMLLFALHSIVDYPLRRPATFPILAFAFSMLWYTQRQYRKPNLR